MPRYSRYVAIGDSQTEGLWDGDDSVGLVGFADRLATMIDSHHPGVTYANLAIRGRRIKDLLDEQLPAALALQPDLISVCIGMNDVTRPGPYFGSALAELDDLHTRLAASGATVLTTTFPDIAKILPIGRVIASRVEQINDEIRKAAVRHGFRLVDLYDAPSMTAAGHVERRPGARIESRDTSCSPPRPPSRSACPAVTTTGRWSTALCGVHRCVRRRIRRCCGRRTC